MLDDLINAADIKEATKKDQRSFSVIPIRAVTDQTLTKRQLQALIALCSYANNRHNLYVSSGRIGRDLGIMQQTAHRLIQQLTRKGYLKTISNKYFRGSHGKPRAVVFDVERPPEDDEWLLNHIEHTTGAGQSISDQPVNALQAVNKWEEKKRVNKLLSVYRVMYQRHYNITPTCCQADLVKLPAGTTIEQFQAAAVRLFAAKTAPPASASLVVRYLE